MAPIITLTTDFGMQDAFAGTMKGVIVGIAPAARIVDITHGLPRGDIRAGAFALMTSAPYFPSGTIHVAVVDPGVGGARSALALRAGSNLYVGPDNGVLSWAVREAPAVEVREIANPEVSLRPVSRTFHGRDVFAPAAAWLAAGGAFDGLGPPRADFIRLPWPEPARSGDGWAGEILAIDTFGNAITSLPERLASPPSTIVLRGGGSVPVRESYDAAEPGAPLAVGGSSGFIEVAINRGSAAERFSLKPGDTIRLVGEE